MTRPVLFGSFAALALLASLAAADIGKKSDSVVKVTTSIEPTAKNVTTAIIDLDVAPGWHLYANPTESEAYDGGAVVVKGADAVSYPDGKSYVDEFGIKVKVYQGNVRIRAAVNRPQTESLELTIRLQACRDGKNSVCLLPATVKLSVR